MKHSLTKLLLMLAVFSCCAQPKGKTIKIDRFKSKFVQARNIEIWLPAEYVQNPKKSYPVLYMQDGQNVFNPATAPHKTAWEADETALKLSVSKRIEPVIIVAVWSTENRYMEYFPEKAAANFSKTERDVFSKILKKSKIKETAFLGDNYLKFLTSELKPYIDKQYRTKPDAANTAICGSDMGALISLYAICEYPDVFGEAACLSTCWMLLPATNHAGHAEAFKKYLFEKLPSPSGHRIYFDHGTENTEKYAETHQKTVDAIMTSKGYTAQNWLTKKYPGEANIERAWQKRFDKVLMFLYKMPENKTPKKTLKANAVKGS